MNKKIKCDIYTRVSTTMQVDGYSLDAQKEKLKRYAEFQNMEIVNEYSDEGKSGKSVEGRPEFQRMLDNIENGTDEVQFVLVFKLSRFGRNAADVLNSLQRMQDFGVNLICVEDGIDSSKDSGKLMISVLSAVAEIERENILVQTMEGRKQKAREGKWNGGFAPYGYELVNGELQIAEDEAEIIRLIYDKFIHTNMGISAIAAWLNQHGYKKKKRQNNTLDAFAASFIKGVLDNPVYCGKLAYGRRKNEKVSGTRNEYRIEKQENYMLHDGIHEGIISETDWELAHQKREKTGVKYEKTHSLDHEHILSGILRCPLCGSGMYGNVNRKKKKDGTLYKDYFYYACKHRRLVDGHKCGYRKQWSEEKINNAVEEVIRKLVKNPKFEEAILNKIGSRIDTEEIEKEIERLEKQHRQLTGAKARLGQQMDSLDIMDKFYEKKYQDMETRLYRLYDEIEGVENSIEEVKNRLLNIRQQKISEENVYQFLLYFDKLYDKFTDLEKKEFYFIYVPYCTENTGFDELMEYLVEHVDYQDESLVEYVYKAYEQYESAGEVYLQTKIFEDAECLRIPEKMDAVEEETTVVVGQDQEKDAIREEEKEMPVGEVTVIKEKKGLFNLWENRKKKEKQERDNYTRSLQLTMTGYAVAEETAYEEEDMGRTVYMEERPAPRESTHRLLSEEGKLLATLEQPIYTIGKKRGETDLVLNDQSISRLHARIIKETDGYYLEDMNSTNGTFKNGLQLQPYERRKLEEGDEITLGKITVIYR